MSIEKHSLDGGDAAIYAETANLNYFLKEALSPDSVDSVVDKQASVKAHTRRRYVGDQTPANVSAHSREYVYDPGRRNGAATPGQNMVLSDGIERRSMTYTGSVMDVRAYLVGNAKMDLKFYSASARYEIKAVAEGSAKVR